MAPEKRNAFLDADESDDDIDDTYDLDDDLRKGGSRTAKRRKLEEDDLSEDDDDVASISDAEEEDRNPGLSEEDAHDVNRESQSKDAVGNDDNTFKKQKAEELPGLSKPLTKKNLIATEKAVQRSGVVYMSRIPPFMKPTKLRSLLEPYGTINRIFLSPEDPSQHSRRVKAGGNKKRSYTDGWVEFVSKKAAKKAVDLLNARTIGGKKGTFYRDDIWNLTYLKGFKWHNLTEQISAEAAERTSRMRAEISRTTKENKEFARNVEKAKMLDGIQSKAAAKRKGGDNDLRDIRSRRKFEQAAVAKKKEGDKLPEDAQRVASMLFA
ncbi:hypothetical protein BJ170DRAFT_611489 [Xylariales sp. AK1849]|nr:hypothetical protein BJ170DRAFT_611489 [Xylariales sp. AK1849]